MAKDSRFGPRQVEDRRWFADPAGTAVENQVEVVAEAGDHRIGIEWRRGARAIRAAASQRFIEGFEQRQRERMVGRPDGERRLAGGRSAGSTSVSGPGQYRCINPAATCETIANRSIAWGPLTSQTSGCVGGRRFTA